MSNPARSELKPSSVQFCRPRLEALELLNILRDNGLSYGDYVEQLTCLLFLKMADKQARPPFNKPAPIEGLRPWIPYSVGSRANGRNRHGAANSFADFQTRSVCSDGLAPQRAYPESVQVALRAEQVGE